ncbi:cytochrome P450 4C1-like isoform X2 [Hyposmocoma kahamanoa]|uniref:cytochrome P450 4C1-like isoform X2 n=1 Tax=Hyposmocoma kahamanoa TaxID=1477025 RepID=UPI000E6D855D|nr:cytochrome P450 4C1-like isoform X2 [Hyposmocoma kahamanoa]
MVLSPCCLGHKLFLTDPEMCTAVANTCLDKSEFYQFGRRWVGDGLVTADVPTWKYHRKLLNPAFSQQVLDGFLGVFNSQARRLVADLEDIEEEFDHWPHLALNGLETICLTSLGMEVNTHEDKRLNKQFFHALEEMFHIIMERVTKVWLYNDRVYSWTRLKKREDKLLEVLHNMSNKILQKRKQELKDNNNILNQIDLLGGKFKPFLDLLLELAEEKSVFTDQEIREHVDTMIVAGHDTSANTLMYTLVLLGSHSKVQENVYQEILEVLGPDRDVEKQDLSRLVYTEAVIKESLRLYPIFPVVTRTLDKDIKLRNYTLFSGNLCFIMVYGLHRHSVWGHDAALFRPERWLDGSLPDSANAFAGFSIGRRGCIGE